MFLDIKVLVALIGIFLLNTPSKLLCAVCLNVVNVATDLQRGLCVCLCVCIHVGRTRWE
jgi:hypothetical protein